MAGRAERRGGQQQIHVDDHSYDHLKFKPWRVQALALKALKKLYPQYELWRDFAYEYEHEKLPIDLINGGPALREWVDDPEAWAGDLDKSARQDELMWIEETLPFRIY